MSQPDGGPMETDHRKIWQTFLLDARYEITARDRDDITWLSPILIAQMVTPWA